MSEFGLQIAVARLRNEFLETFDNDPVKASVAMIHEMIQLQWWTKDKALDVASEVFQLTQEQTDIVRSQVGYP